MNILEELSTIIEAAEASARQEHLKEALEAAEQEWISARQNYEAATQALNRIQQECADPDDRLKADLEKLEELKKRRQQVGSFIPDSCDLDRLFARASADIESRYHKDKARLQEAGEQVRVCRTTQEEARTRYEELRRQSTELGLAADSGESTPAFSSPGEEVEDLIETIETSKGEIALWTPEERHAMFSVWLGKARKLQDVSGLTEEEEKELHHLVFGQLNTLRKQYPCDYIQALDRQYIADWDAYVRKHLNRYTELCEQNRKEAEREKAMNDLQLQEQRRRREARQNAATYFSVLAELCNEELTEKTGESIVQTAEIILKEVGVDASDPELIDLLYPLRELFEQAGSSFRGLRRSFRSYERELQSGTLKERYTGVVKRTRGKKATLVGGSPRERKRRQLQKFFEWTELKWEPCQGNEPRILKRIEQSIRSGGVDMIIELIALVGHNVENLKPVCEGHGVAFVRVQRGYGINAIADALSTHIE